MAKVDKTIQAYNKVAKQYNRSHYSADFWRNEFNLFTSFLQGKRVLDVGCGAGRDAVLFSREGFDYIGIDASIGMLAVARTRVKKARFIKMNFYDITFPAKTFDGFWAAASLLHIPKKRIRFVLKQLRRIIRRGGVGFVVVKAKRNIADGVIKEDKYGGIERYFAFYTPTELTNLLEKVGFVILRWHQRSELGKKVTKWLCFFVQRAPLQ